MRKHFAGLVSFGAVVWLLSAGCASPPPKRTLTMIEQIAEDNQTAKNLWSQFEKKIEFERRPDLEKYLNQLARKLAQGKEGSSLRNVRIRIHLDKNPAQSRWFSFPGTVISIPASALKQIEYENELAAGIAYELANVLNRHLAHKMEGGMNPILFGDGSIFELDRSERGESLQLGTKLMYYAGYDLRGM